MVALSRPPAPSKAFLMARLLAAERGIFSLEELHKLVVAEGITISSSQFGKVLRNQTRYCDMELLDALRKVLDTSYDKLLVSRALKRIPATTRSVKGPTGSEPKSKQPLATNHEEGKQNQTLTPPAFTALPKR